MAGHNTVGAFGYRLHQPTAFIHGQRSVDLRGVPQVPRAVDAWMKYEGSESERHMPQLIEQQMHDAIEAACYVLHLRHGHQDLDAIAK